MTEPSENRGYNSCIVWKPAKPIHKGGEHLMTLRLDAGLSKDKVAIGVPQQTIAFCERTGKPRMILEDASRLSRRQQKKIAEFMSAFIKQYKQSAAKLIKNG